MAKKQQIDYNALPDIEEVDYSALPDIEGDSKKKEPSTEVSKSLEEPSTSVGTDDVTTQGLSFREQERESVPDYMGLFDNKDKVEAANSLGVSLDFYNQVNQAAKSAERPTEFLFDVENMKRRLNALPEYFPELSSDVEAIKSKLKDVNALNIESIKASVDAIEGKVYSPPVSFGMMGDVNTGNPNWTNYEQEVLKNPQALATERLLMDTKNVRQAASEEGGVGSIVSGTGKGLEKWLVDWAKFSDDLRSNPAVKQMEDKLFSDNPDKKEFWESLTTDERILARAIVDNYQTRASLLEQVPTSFKIGEAVGQSIGFMAEFAATAGAGAGTATTIRGLAGAGKLSRMGVGAWAKLAQSGIQVAAMPTLYRNIALDVSKGESFGKSMLDNYWELGAETLSERIFLKNPATKDALSAADRIFRRMGINFATDKGYAGVVKNIAEEYAEEKFSEVATAPKDYKDFRSFWNEFVDKENLAVTLGSVSIMVGAPGGAVTTLDKAGRVYDQVKMKRLENIVPKDIREEVDVILSDTELGVKEQYDLIIQSVNDRATQEELGENPADMAANVLRYAKAKVKERVQETAENENWQEQRVAETETPTAGEVEPVGEMQQKLDYLIERGVEVPDGSKEADVDKLYRQERVKVIKEGNAELDVKIAEAQTRLGLETTPDVEISDDTELTLEQLDNGEPVTNEFLKKASDELYEKYNELEAMKQSDSRVYTTEQIESMQEFLGEEITKLEDYAKEQAETGKFVGETETGEITEEGTEEIVEVKPKIKEDGKEMQEREGAQQGVQKPEDEVTERSEETAEAVEAAGEEAVVPVTSFKKGDGGTKGTFKDKSGKIYKSLVPQRAVFKDGKAVREPIEGATTDEHSILSELQDRSYVPKVGGVVETSEGAAFEIEELSEVDKLSRDEYLQLRANIEQLNSDGYQIGDMVSVMRRPDTGEVVITDFSTAQKGVKDANDVDLLSGVEEKLSPKDRAWVDTRSKAVNARKVAELVGERLEGNKYLLTQRPPSIGTHPIEGLVGDPVEKQMDGRTVYELSYEKPLSDAEVQRFELSPVLSPSDYVGMIASGVTPGIDFYVKNVKDRTVTLEAVAPNGKTITNNMRTAEFVRKINNNELSLSEPSLKPTTSPQKPSDRVSPEKGVTTPPAEKVAETAPTQADIAKLEQTRAKLERETKKAENKERLARIFDNAARLTGARKDVVGDERKQIRKQLIDDVIDYVKTEFELAGQALVDRVKSFVKENNLPVEDLQDNEITKSKSYAEEIGEKVKKPVQEKGTEQKKVRQVRVRDDEKDRVETKPPKKGVKESRLGVRYAFGEGFSEKAKEEYAAKGLHEYDPEKQEDVIVIAKSIMELNDLDKIQRIFDNKQLPRRVRTVVGALLAQEYSNQAEKFLKAGDLKNGDDFIDREQAVMKSMQDELATESGRDVAIFGADLIMEILTPYKTARQIERSITNRREGIRKSKSFKNTKTIVEGELSDLRRSVLREVGKQQRVVEAKKKATRKKDPEKEKIRNRISSLKDQLRAARRGSASMSIVGLSSEEIEILGNIAVEYVKLGFVNIKQLVQKLKKDAADVGLTLTDEQAKSVIPKIDGKDVETLEKEQAIRDAAESLALKEFGHVADKKTKKDDPVLQMVNALVSKFKERAEEGEKPKRKSALDIVTEAIVNKDKYMSVWKAAKKEVDDLITKDENLSAEQKELYKERVAQAYKNATEFSVSERQVQQLIRDTLREQNISIDDVVRDHYDRKELHKQQLIRDLQKRAGLDGEAAQELADVIDNAFNTLMAEKGTKIVDRYLGKKNKKQTKKEHKDEVARLIELINIGALDTVEGNELMLDLYGVRNLTSEEKTRIKNLATLVQKTKSPQKRHKNAQRMMSYVYSLQKVDPAEVAVGFWYGNVLFGLGTHMKNYFDAYISSWVETAKMAGYNPMVLKRAILAHFRGYWKEGGVRFRETMATGVTPIQKRFDIPSILERGDFAAAEGSGIIGKVNMTLLNWYKNALKYNLRLLPGFDSLIYASAQEAMADIMATREVLASYSGQKKTKELRAQIQKEIDTKLALLPDIRATIEAKVEKESQEYADLQESLGEPRTGYSKREKAIRVYELINEARPISIVEDAYDIAGRTLGNIATYGYIGRMVSVLSNQILRKAEMTFRKPIFQLKNITKKGRPVFTFQDGKEIKVKPLALVMAFTRIVANVATRNLGGNLLVAMARAKKGRFGIFLGKDDPYRVEMTELERTQSKRWIWQLAVLQTMLYLLTEPGEDDEDPALQITLNGTGDYKRNKKELEPTGWQPYSIIVSNPANPDKDWHLDYRLLGTLAVPLMAVGYMRDKQRYQDSEKSDMALMMEGLLVSIPLVLETTPIFGLRKLTDAFFDITKGGDDGFNKLLQLTGGMGTGFIPAPRVFSDIEDIWDTVMEEPHKTAVTGYEKLLQYIPFYGKLMPYGRTAYDVFGKEIPAKSAVQRIIGNAKEDKLIQYYLNNGYKRPVHDMNDTSFMLYDEDGNIVRRKLKGGNREEVSLFDDYDQATGLAFEQAVQEALDAGMEGQEMVDFLDKSWRRIVDDAKKAVFAASQDFPVKYDKDAEVIQ